MNRCEHCILADCSACQPPRKTGGFFTSALNAASKPSKKERPAIEEQRSEHRDWWDCAPINKVEMI